MVGSKQDLLRAEVEQLAQEKAEVEAVDEEAKAGAE